MPSTYYSNILPFNLILMSFILIHKTKIDMSLNMELHSNNILLYIPDSRLYKIPL